MAEPLKNKFGIAIPRQIASMISQHSTTFDQATFLHDVDDGYEALDLMPRARKIARSLRDHLPDNYLQAMTVLLASLGPKLEKTSEFGMAPFLYLPHVFFVAEYGLEHFELSMQAQYELTQRFTAEFSMRAYLDRYPEATLGRLKEWTRDASPHVRRLVSESTRPRLPWAPRLRAFQKDPKPVLALLELLKDDPELYVRRSVANNLNDIGKDHPSLLVETAQRWLHDATTERRWLIQHALRSAVKRAEPEALAVLGFDATAKIVIGNIQITPEEVRIDQSVDIGFTITSSASSTQKVLVDFAFILLKLMVKPVQRFLN